MKTSIFLFMMVFLVVISITISFKGEDGIDTGISILQPADAQDHQEGEDDADTTTEPREKGNSEQDIDKEESLTREKKEEPDSGKEEKDEVQREEEIKEDCASDEHFDFDANACIPNKEKVCHDGRDNDNDDKVDLEDSDCQTNEKQIEQENNKEEEEDIEKPREEEKYVNNKEDIYDWKNSLPSLELKSNETMSSDDYSTEGKTKNSQNLTDIHSPVAFVSTISNNTNNASSGNHSNTDGSVVEATFTLKCNPTDIQMMPGTERSIFCTAENKIHEPIELAIGCLGLDGTGVECYIDGEDSLTGTILLKELSNRNFSILIASESSPPVPVGSYPFSINAECINTNLCQSKT
jgi:hypothetical protein